MKSLTVNERKGYSLNKYMFIYVKNINMSININIFRGKDCDIKAFYLVWLSVMCEGKRNSFEKYVRS